jgi:hypothetical protein
MQYICNAISSMRSAKGIGKKTATRRDGNALGGHEIFSPFAASAWIVMREKRSTAEIFPEERQFG